MDEPKYLYYNSNLSKLSIFAAVLQLTHFLNMKKLLCPQCKISSMYVKNDKNERRLVYIDDNHNVIPKYPDESLEGFDLTEVYCLGCSWNGSPKRLSGKY